MTRAAATFRSADLPRITGLLPPSSRVTGTRFSAAARMTWRATEVAPVKIRWSKARREKASPTSGPPVTTAISSSEKAPANIVRISSEVAGVNSEGLIMARLPAARMPARGAKVRFTGKFQGLITPTTPLGWKRTSALAPNRPRMAGVGLRFSGRIHLARLSRACCSGPMEPAMSVKAVASRDREPKSVLRVSSMAWRFSRRRRMQRSMRSIRRAALASPSRRWAAFWRSRMACMSMGIPPV